MLNSDRRILYSKKLKNLVLLISISSFFMSAAISNAQTFTTKITSGNITLLDHSAYDLNWAGYILTPQEFGFNKKVEEVNGTFTVPQVYHSPLAQVEYTSTWLGIDGYDANTLIQSGVSEANDNGKAYYSAWYELFPALPVTINMTVKPGDNIYVQITLTNSSINQWNIYLEDLSTGSVFSKYVYFNTPMTSAEWVVEAPGIPTQVLAPFSTVYFRNAHLYVCGFVFCQFYQLGQISPHILFANQSKTAAASPSAILPDNMSFSVSYTGVQPAPVKTTITPYIYTVRAQTQSTATLSAQLGTNTSFIADQQLNFYANNKFIGNAYTNATGVASISFNTSVITPSQTNFGATTIPIYASFAGNQTYNSSTSIKFNLNLYEQSSYLSTLPSSTSSVAAGQNASIYVRLQSGSDYLQNQIVSLDLNGESVKEVTNQQGVADFSFNTGNLSPGLYQLYLSYNGSDVYNQSSVSYNIQVLPMATTTSTPTTTIVTTSTGPVTSPTTTLQTGYGQGAPSSTFSSPQNSINSWIIFIIILIFAVVATYVVNKERERGRQKLRMTGTNKKVENVDDAAYQTLKQRYAKGEISEEEYWKMKKELERDQ